MCDVCGRTIGHDTRCPYYFYPPQSAYKCCYCDEPIIEYDKYIENNGEYIHVDCIPSSKWLLDWLHIEVKEMDREDCS